MTTKRSKATTETKTALIYVGPNSKTIQRYTIFKAGLPSFVENEINACPSLKPLFVPVEKLNEVQQRLSDSTSAESIFYKEAQKHFKGVKK